MHFRARLCLLLLLPAGLLTSCRAKPHLDHPLHAALERGDEAAVQALVATERQRLGAQAGEPEVKDRYQPVPEGAAWLSAEQAQAAWTRDFKTLQSLAARWKPGLDPSQLREPLRAPATVLSGCVAIAKAGLDGQTEALNLARSLADYLMWTQDQAGAGCFPFPAARGTSSAQAMQVGTRFQEKAERAGQLAAITRNDWIFDDLGDGGLQFDNSECGVALLELYEVGRDPRHLASAQRAADWALNRPLCPNWNYNAFSVHLLAKAHAITGESRYLEAAVRKARLGVLPGQLTDGPRAGRWLDPHNARPAYHYIITSALAQLAAVLPASHPQRVPIQTSLEAALTSRNAEFLSRGVMTKDKAMEALLLTESLLARDPAFLKSTHTSPALHVLGALVSEEQRRGKHPLGPRAWGQFLARAASAPPPPAVHPPSR